MTRPTRLTQLTTAAAIVVVAGFVSDTTAAARTETAPPAQSQLRLPVPTGSRPIGTATLYVTDRSRRVSLAPTQTQRELVVQLWYPAATGGGPLAAYASPAIASLLETTFNLPNGTFSVLPTPARQSAPIARGRHPLLLLSHGLGTLREFHTALAGDLASRGYIVAAITHTYDAAAAELADGRVIEGTAPAQPTDTERALLVRTRVGDVRFVLDELLERSRARSGLLAGRISADQIGALGHSLGGATAAAAMLEDPRIRAGADLDGTIFGPVAAQGLGRPFMLIVGDHVGGALVPDQAQFYRRLRSTRYALSLRGAGHYSFTDVPLFAAALPGLAQAFDIGTIDPLRAHAATRAYVAAFFDRTLRNRQVPLLDGRSAAYPEVRFLDAGAARASFARRSEAARAEVAPVGALPRARVTTVVTHSGSLVAVALPAPQLRPDSSGGLRAAWTRRSCPGCPRRTWDRPSLPSSGRAALAAPRSSSRSRAATARGQRSAPSGKGKELMRLALYCSCLALGLAGAAPLIAQDTISAPASVRPQAPVPAADPRTVHGRVAYSTRAGDIWVMNANGSGRRRLTRSGPDIDFDPSFSPKARYVVFRTSRGRYAPDTQGMGLEGIFVMNARTRGERQIQPPTGGLFPAWSPDGRKIAFSGLPRGGGILDTIHLMNPDGSGVVDLVAPGECATWSPDSSRLMYCSHPGDGNWAVWVMNADGSGRRQLTHPTLMEPAGANGDYPGAWSPDGEQIVYSSVVDGDRELFLMNADGSNQRRLTRFRGGDGAVAWLPDGRIVFSHFRRDEPLPHWYLIKPDGSSLHSLPWFYGAGDPLDWIQPR